MKKNTKNRERKNGASDQGVDVGLWHLQISEQPEGETIINFPVPMPVFRGGKIVLEGNKF
jgi:hypothetical protein